MDFQKVIFARVTNEELLKKEMQSVNESSRTRKDEVIKTFLVLGKINKKNSPNVLLRISITRDCIKFQGFVDISP